MTMLISIVPRSSFPTYEPGGGTSSWTFNSLEVLVLLAVAVAYALRARHLAASGSPVSIAKKAMFGSGLLLVFLAVCSPLELLGHRMFLAHMFQHITLGDYAAILVTLGLSRELLEPVLRLPGLRRVRQPIQPLLAFLLWAGNLAAWHSPVLFELMHRNGDVALVEQACYFIFGCYLWASITGPLRRPEWFGMSWRIAFVLGVCAWEALLANILFWSPDAIYTTYVGLEPMLGLSPVEDLNYGGALMMTNGTILGIILLGGLFYRLSIDSELEQRLVESGMPVDEAHRAVLTGKAEELLGDVPGAREPTVVGVADR